MSISNKCKLFQDVDDILLWGPLIIYRRGEAHVGGIHVIFRGKRTGSVVANRETEYNEGTMEN